MQNVRLSQYVWTCPADVWTGRPDGGLRTDRTSGCVLRTYGRDLRTSGCVLRTSECVLRASGCVLRTVWTCPADVRIQNVRLSQYVWTCPADVRMRPADVWTGRPDGGLRTDRTSGCGLRTYGCVLRTYGCVLRTSGCVLRASGWRFTDGRTGRPDGGLRTDGQDVRMRPADGRSGRTDTSCGRTDGTSGLGNIRQKHKSRPKIWKSSFVI
jgi:hypothetical protein